MGKLGALMCVLVRSYVYDLLEEVGRRKLTASEANEKLDNFLREEEALLEDERKD